MRCIAIIEAQRANLDSVILWDRGGELVAFAYLDGRVSMTRPLASITLDTAINEARDNFQITAGQISRVTDWTNTISHPPERIAAKPRERW